MELKDFIRESLEQICFGIREAQINVSRQIGHWPIAPAFIAGKAVYKESTEINFDIAITVSKDSLLEATGKAGISVVGGGIKSESKAASENVHRISFSIPFHPSALGTDKETAGSLP